MKSIIIGSDHAGFRLKKTLKSFLSRKKFKIIDVGTHCEDSCDYPDFVYLVADKISRGKIKKGIIICKSGIGSSIAANRFPGVRAALCYNLRTARLSRQHNDSNVLVLGQGFVASGLAKKITRKWLDTSFEGGRHKRRLAKIKRIERKLKRR
jgi:ribose 5-phosphate isomerase B